ncbi:hypothetical protein HPB48_026809 [Haemaphysalis longicornis]|uniref:Uncharacterized protein n=1 Tax=Haemaphysalis longicornis TaxID=44386 RepID=A0A9J6HCG2_HAELO|nr:hypothetical protein HPB48_026809 [Haemaphysalis longicornis]
MDARGRQALCAPNYTQRTSVRWRERSCDHAAHALGLPQSTTDNNNGGGRLIRIPPSVRDAVTSVNYEPPKMAAELALAAIERQRPKVRLSTTPCTGSGE